MRGSLAVTLFFVEHPALARERPPIMLHLRLTRSVSAGGLRVPISRATRHLSSVVVIRHTANNKSHHGRTIMKSGIITAATSALLFSGVGNAAEIKVLSTQATEQTYRELL